MGKITLGEMREFSVSGPLVYAPIAMRPSETRGVAGRGRQKARSIGC